MNDFVFEIPVFQENDPDRQRAVVLFAPAVNAFLAAVERGSSTLQLPRGDGRWRNLKGFTYHLEPELFFQAQGGCQFRFPNQTVELIPGDILLVPPGLPHREKLNNYGGHPFRNFVLMGNAQSASFHLAGASHDESRLPEIDLRVKLADPLFYHHLTETLAVRQDNRNTHSDAIRRNLLAALLLKLRDDLTRTPPQPVGENSGGNRLAQLAREYLDENFPSRFPSVPEIARAIGCSPNYLSSVFRRDHGMTVKEYINALKFDYARRMLEHSTFNISEIAGSCGFNDVSYFSRKFRERFGKNPSEIR